MIKIGVSIVKSKATTQSRVRVTHYEVSQIWKEPKLPHIYTLVLPGEVVVRKWSLPDEVAGWKWFMPDEVVGWKRSLPY